MGHAISNLALGVGESFLYWRKGVGHNFFINHISKWSCTPPPSSFPRGRWRYALFHFSLALCLRQLLKISAVFCGQKVLSSIRGTGEVLLTGSYTHPLSTQVEKRCFRFCNGYLRETWISADGIVTKRCRKHA